MEMAHGTTGPESAPHRVSASGLAVTRRDIQGEHTDPFGRSQLAERKGAVEAAGFPAFRAAQLSRQYFARFANQAAQMTDLPTANAALVARSCRRWRRFST